MNDVGIQNIDNASFARQLAAMEADNRFQRMIIEEREYCRFAQTILIIASFIPPILTGTLCALKSNPIKPLDYRIPITAIAYSVINVYCFCWICFSPDENDREIIRANNRRCLFVSTLIANIFAVTMGSLYLSRALGFGHNVSLSFE